MSLCSVRLSGRQADELRSIVLERGFSRHAEGSCLVRYGETIVLCTASVEERVPPWMRGRGKGWVTAEYGMLPRATAERTRREAMQGQTGRTKEVQRLIGRALRAVTNLEALGERRILLDCDVIQADGGTRVASITGAWVALRDCIASMQARGAVSGNPLRARVAAVSCALCGDGILLDPDYAEDSTAEVDANFVMSETGDLVEVQLSAEQEPFSDKVLMDMLVLARRGIAQIVQMQGSAVS